VAPPRRARDPVRSRKQLAERALAAGQQSMNVPRLGYAGSVRGVRRQRVPFQHDDMLEMMDESARRCQTTHTRADNDGLLANKMGCHPCLR
jgi:hypothetical protein